jgi:iron complex transport system substrate-binding protein
VLKPRRIVCLTAETTELAFALGCADRIVGVSGYAIRPPEARKKPRVAAFQTAHVDRILALQPDLVLGFSDLQAEIAAELIRRGANVLITNQRTLDETFAAMTLVAGALGEPAAGAVLVETLRDELERLRPPAPLAYRPRTFFEEWDDPLISGIAWVSELIELCGGDDIFPELRTCAAATQRIVEPGDVVARDPEVVIASWCGKKANLQRIAQRPGWANVSAVQHNRIYEIKAPDILQPGLSLIHGAREIARLIAEATA